jgi:hypothetical protein
VIIVIVRDGYIEVGVDTINLQEVLLVLLLEHSHTNMFVVNASICFSYDGVAV